MVSGNSSGSTQSSSGGEEEYDSRAESSSFSISAFLNNQQPPSTHVAPPFSTSNNILPNSHPQHRHNNTHMFDPLSNYLDPIQRITPPLPNTSSLLNLDVMWSKPARSEPNHTDLGCLIPCSSSSSPHNQVNQLPGQTRGNSAAFLGTHHTLLPSENGSRELLSVSAANNNDQAHDTTNMVRNPRKRSRASRRAPTTVLTTDTTNFRAMVQEFTGIPAPPFTSSPFPRTRLDLFASPPSSSSIRSTTRLDPPYLLRPFAQKLTHLHPFPPPSSASSLSPASFLPSTILLASSNNPTNSTTSSNHQLSSSVDHLDFLKQHPNNFNMHNPGLTFQNILQAPQKYPLGNSSSLEIPPSADSHLKMGVFEELGLRHDRVNTDVNCLHQNTVLSPSVGVGALSGGNNNMSSSNASMDQWAQRTGTITNNDCDHGGGALRSLSGTVNYSDISERVTNGKVHYSASSSDFHGEKGPECTVAARSQGMVESWIN